MSRPPAPFPDSFLGRPARAAAAVAAIVIAVVAMCLRDEPAYLEPVYLKTPVSLLQHRDLYHLREEYWSRQYLEGRTFDDTRHVTATGHDAIPTPLGRGFYAWPFFEVGRALAPLIERGFGPGGKLPLLPAPAERDGLFPHCFAWQNLSGLIPFTLALILLWRTTQKRTGGAAASAALAAVYFGTYLFHTLRYQPGASEAVALLFWSAAFSLSLDLWETGRLPPHRAILLGFCCGSAVFVRLTSVLWLIPPLAGVARSLIGRRERPVRLLLAGLLFLATAAAAAAPQLLVWKCWWGTWIANAYGHFTRPETLGDIAAVALSHPQFLLYTPIAWLGLLGLLFGFRRRPAFALAGFAIFALMVANGFGLTSFIETQSVADRHFLILVPYYMFGLAELIAAVPRRGMRAAILAIAGAAVVSHLEMFSQLTPALGRRLAGFDYWREVARWGWHGIMPGPVSRMGLFLGALLLIPAAAAGGAAALWGRLPERWRGGVGRGATTFMPLLVAAALLATTAKVCANSQRAVAEAEEAGFYRDRWRTLAFAWRYFTGDAQIRLASYLALGRFAAAAGIFDLVINIDPGGEGEAGSAPEIVRDYRDSHAIPGHLWGSFCAAYRLPGRVREIGGAEWSDRWAIEDGDLATFGRATGFTGEEPAILIRLDRSAGPLSDLVVVLAEDAAVPGVDFGEIADSLVVEVSADGRNWIIPFRVERRYDTLWIWDLYQRPWNWVRLSGFPAPAAASLSEIFAFFSLRHAR